MAESENPVMIIVDYPVHQYKIREPGPGREEIWDDARRIWVRLTPEEWVRQNFVQYLIQVCHFPAPYIAMEKRIQIGEVKKRFDVLVYNRAARPWLMIECKAKEVSISKKTLTQILNYNIAVPVPYLIVTNGDFTFGFHRVDNDFREITRMPEYE